MAVTITQSPPEYTPSDNPILWVFSSDETAQPNFRYLVEVYINSVLHSQHQVFPENGIYGKFDAMSIAKSICTYDEPNITDIVQENFNWTRMQIKVIELYGTPPAQEDDATSSEIFPFKACFSNDFYPTYLNTANQYIQGGISRKFSSFRDKANVIDIRLQGAYYIGIINDFDTRTVVRCNLYQEDGTLIAGAQVSLTISLIATRITTINLDPQLWIAGTALTTGNYDDASYIEVYILETSGNTRVSEIRRFDIDKRDCYFGRQLTFLNKFGNYETFVFFHNQQTKTAINQESYSKGFGDWSGNDYVFNPAKSGTFDYVKRMTDKASITSDYMNQEVFNWLVSEVLESPFVLAQNDNLTPYRVLPRNGEYTEAQNRFEELFDLTVDCDLPNMRFSPLI